MRPRLVMLVALLLLAGCGGGDDGGGGSGDAPPDAGEPFEVTSPAFEAGAELPPRFTCDGRGIAPALEWSGVPEEAQSLAIVVDDPDAPGGTFLHWSVWGLAPQVRTITGEGPVEGRNDFGRRGYGAPCPPEGDEPHTYRFTVHALSGPLPLERGARADEVSRGLERLSVGSATLEATYGR